MSYEERIIRHDDDVHDDVHRIVRSTPSGGEVTRRIVVLLFGIVQVLILLRIAFLLLDAREANPIVDFILTTSQLFVAPFEGIFRTDALQSGGSVLDVTAIAALIGWTILEVIILWVVSVVRREPSVA